MYLYLHRNNKNNINRKAMLYYNVFLTKNKNNYIINKKVFRNKMDVINYSFNIIFKIDVYYVSTYIKFIDSLDKIKNEEKIMNLLDKTFIYLLNIQKNMKKNNK